MRIRARSKRRVPRVDRTGMLGRTDMSILSQVIAMGRKVRVLMRVLLRWLCGGKMSPRLERGGTGGRPCLCGESLRRPGLGVPGHGEHTLGQAALGGQAGESEGP